MSKIGPQVVVAAILFLLGSACARPRLLANLYGGGARCQGNIFLSEIKDYREDMVEEAQELAAYGPLCSGMERLLDHREANAICSSIGSSVAYYQSFTMFGITAPRPNFQNLRCGDSGSLESCDYDFIRPDDDDEAPCNLGYVGSVICDSCVTEGGIGDVRLLGGASPCQGAVQVKHRLGWGFLDGSAIDSHVGDVICKSLGYTASTHIFNSSVWLYNATFEEYSLAYTGNYYQHVSADSVSCPAGAGHLRECNITVLPSRIVAAGTVYETLASVTDASRRAAGVTCYDSGRTVCDHNYVPTMDMSTAITEGQIGVNIGLSFYSTSLSPPRSYVWVIGPIMAVIIFVTIVSVCVCACKRSKAKKLAEQQAKASGERELSQMQPAASSSAQPPAQSLRQVSPLQPPHSVEQGNQMPMNSYNYAGSAMQGVGVQMWMPGQLGVPVGAQPQQLPQSMMGQALPVVQPQLMNAAGGAYTSSNPNNTTAAAGSGGNPPPHQPAAPAPASLPATVQPESVTATVSGSVAAADVAYSYNPTGNTSGGGQSAEVRHNDVHL